MSKSLSVALSLFCFLAAGCKKDAPSRVVAQATGPPLSLMLLDGVVPQQVPIQIGGQRIQATIFPKNLGESGLFLCYYTLPTAAQDTEARTVAINAEIDRCVANTGATILSRKTNSADNQPSLEVVAKSPKKMTHSIRCRVICTGNEIQSLTAVTPDGQDASHAQALDKMFEEFHAK